MQRDMYLQSSMKVAVKIPNKNVDCILETFQKQVEDYIDAKDKKKTLIKKK